jgi:hypothetical protein
MLTGETEHVHGRNRTCSLDKQKVFTGETEHVQLQKVVLTQYGN